MDSPPRGPQPPERARTDQKAEPRLADRWLIDRLLGSAPAAAGGESHDDASVIVEAVELGEPPVGSPRLSSRPLQPHRMVSLPVDHRKQARVVRLHEPHLERSSTEDAKFAHWRRWMAESKRKESAR